MNKQTVIVCCCCCYFWFLCNNSTVCVLCEPRVFTPSKCIAIPTIQNRIESTRTKEGKTHSVSHSLTHDSHKSKDNESINHTMYVIQMINNILFSLPFVCSHSLTIPRQFCTLAELGLFFLNKWYYFLYNTVKSNVCNLLKSFQQTITYNACLLRFDL